MTRIVNTGAQFPTIPNEPDGRIQKSSRNPLDNKVAQASTQRMDPRKSQIIERRNSEQSMKAKPQTPHHNPTTKKIHEASTPVVNPPPQGNVNKLVAMYEQKINQTFRQEQTLKSLPSETQEASQQSIHQEVKNKPELVKTTGSRNLKETIPKAKNWFLQKLSRNTNLQTEMKKIQTAGVQAKNQISELINTEKSYLDGVKVLTQKGFSIKNPDGTREKSSIFGILHKSGAMSKKDMETSEKAVHDLVVSAEKILGKLEPLLQKLNDAKTPEELAKAVEESFTTIISTYNNYNLSALARGTGECVHLKSVWDKAAGDATPEVVQTIERQIQRSTGKPSMLGSLFILPAQRFPRLEMLMKEMIKSADKMSTVYVDSKIKTLTVGLKQKLKVLLDMSKLIDLSTPAASTPPK